MTVNSLKDTSVSGSLAHYKANDSEDTGTIKYFGFETADGEWYILEMSNSDTQFRYAKGLTDYTTAWTNRASQSYGLYGDIF